MRILIAFDKFKDALTAREACEHAAEVLRRRHPDWTLDVCPLTDGGEGFADVLTAAAGGQLQSLPVKGPLGRAVHANYGIVRWGQVPPAARALLPVSAAVDRIAVIEMAQASGLSHLAQHERDPWLTSSFGTGELIRDARERGAQAIVLGVGGSATHDLGLGALAALGLMMHDAQQQPLHFPAPATWARAIGFSGGAGPLPPVWVACDVTHPLLGPNGAAATFGAQKGLKAVDLSALESLTAEWAEKLCRHSGRAPNLSAKPGTGAAGGLGFGLMAAAGAQLVTGFPLVAAWLDLEKRIQAADLVITGEGRFDESSLLGKGPGALALRALSAARPVHLFAGQALAPARPGLSLYPLTAPGTPLLRALRDTRINLERAVARAFA